LPDESLSARSLQLQPFLSACAEWLSPRGGERSTGKNSPPDCF